MKRFLDVVRSLVLSLEVVALMIVVGVQLYAPDTFSPLMKPMKEGLGFGLGAATLALGALAFSYKEGSDILDPSGGKHVLLEWPGYFMLKSRILAAFCWCGIGIGAILVATWAVAIDVRTQHAAALLVGGVFVSAIAAASVAIARLRVRELLPDRPDRLTKSAD